jgi:hypothetical protein
MSLIAKQTNVGVPVIYLPFSSFFEINLLVLFQKMMKNPAKLMELVKKISSKFQEKMKRGDISQEEVMKEATEMLRKMKEMGGDSKQMTEMFLLILQTIHQLILLQNFLIFHQITLLDDYEYLQV